MRHAFSHAAPRGSCLCVIYRARDLLLCLVLHRNEEAKGGGGPGVGLFGDESRAPRVALLAAPKREVAQHVAARALHLLVVRVPKVRLLLLLLFSKERRDTQGEVLVGHTLNPWSPPAGVRSRSGVCEEPFGGV